MKNFIYKLSLILSVCLFSISNLFANVDLGQIYTQTPPPTGTTVNQNFPVSHAFDGDHESFTNYWLANSVSDFIRWNVDPFQTVNVDTTIYDSLRITLNIYNGESSNNQIGNLNEFRIRVHEGSTSRLITDFHNLESTQMDGFLTGTNAGESLPISHDNEWITALNSEELASETKSMHSITFSTTAELSQIEILLHPESTHSAIGFFAINEIETLGVAVVPEPSTYALLLGASVLLFRVLRNKKLHQLSPNN